MNEGSTASGGLLLNLQDSFQICSSLSDLIPEEICKSAIEAALPSIIDGIVNQYMTPMQVLTTIIIVITKVFLNIQKLNNLDQAKKFYTYILREHLPKKKMFSFGHCPNEGGGGPCPN